MGGREVGDQLIDGVVAGHGGWGSERVARIGLSPRVD